MDVDLKKAGAAFVCGFFVLAALVSLFVPYKTFVAATKPDRLPFTIKDARSIAITTLPDDHVVLLYIQDDAIYYRESFTRGFLWRDPVFVIDGLNDAGNLTAKYFNIDENHVLYLAWDALMIPGNQSSRRVFFLVFYLDNHTIRGSASLCAGQDTGLVEMSPSIGQFAGGQGVIADHDGPIIAWVEVDGDVHRVVYKSFSTAGEPHTPQTLVASQGPAAIKNPTFLVEGDSAYLFYILEASNLSRTISLYIKENETRIHLETTGKIEDIAVSPSSNGFVAMAVRTSNAIDAGTHVYWLRASDGEINESASTSINATSNPSFISQQAFSNDQILVTWIQDQDKTDGIQEIWFEIIDFEMSNRNSQNHSILLSYIFFACGIFNLFVYMHLKKRNGNEESEPLNNIFTSILFWVIGIIFLLPWSGFQGERLGESYADGYVMPAPINLATIIVIGFSFLFFLVSTPLIDRYWRPNARFKRLGKIKEDAQPFSLRQEVVRKFPHMINILLIPGFTPIGSTIMRIVDLQKYDRYNFVNEGGIIFDYVLRLNEVEIGSYAVKLMVTAGLVFLWVLDLHVLLCPKRYFFLKDFFVYSLRKKEKSSMADFVMMYLAILVSLVILTFNPQYKLQGVFVMFSILGSLCIADTVGVFVGKTIGKHKFSPRAKKSWEGALSGLLVSFLLSIPFMQWYFALIVGGVYLLVDLITPKFPVSDNVLIPILTMVAMLPFLPFVSSPLMAMFT